MLWLRKYRDAILCGLLLSVPFFFLRANTKAPADLNALDRALLVVSAPIQYVGAAMGRFSGDLWDDYVYLLRVRRENDRLQFENARLREDNRRSVQEAEENRRLRHLLQFREALTAETLSAQAIDRDVSPYFRVLRIRIDRGEHDDLRPGMPVVSSEGLVGQIRRTWSRYADVLLTADPQSRVDVEIQRNGASGILRGTGESDRYAARIEYLLREQEVRVGDQVYTSGIGRRFPRGILVGHVSRVQRLDSGLYQEAEVTPAVAFSRLREVLVMVTPQTDSPDAATRQASRN